MFNEISPTESTSTIIGRAHIQTRNSLSHRRHHDTTTLVKRGAELLERALTSFDSGLLRSCIDFWLSKGVNIALAEPFVHSCCEAFWSLSSQPTISHHWLTQQSQNLLDNSMRPFDLRPTMLAADFISQTCAEHLRWESLGIFFSAIVRATFDLPFFPGLYKDDDQKLALRSFAVQLSDDILDLSISMDCLNDFQAVLQYENFIMHSHVDGDHS